MSTRTFMFEDEVSADVQRGDTPICIDSGVSQLACHSGRMSELTARGTAPTLISTKGSSIEQRGYEKMRRRTRAVGKMKRIGSLWSSRMCCFLL